MIVAIDGPAASGKGTLGRHVAGHFGYHHLDTGLIYRAVARALLDSGSPLDDPRAAAAAARALDLSRWPESTLRTAGMGEAASKVAVLPAVRDAVLEFQRSFARRPPGAVVDGRDIGTIVLPEADVKLFVTADDRERARRRALELAAGGFPVDEAVVLADIRHRDAQDANRPVAPLRQADDAILLDTTDLTIEAAFRAAIVIVEAARHSRGEDST